MVTNEDISVELAGVLVLLFGGVMAVSLRGLFGMVGVSFPAFEAVTVGLLGLVLVGWYNEVEENGY